MDELIVRTEELVRKAEKAGSVVVGLLDMRNIVAALHIAQEQVKPQVLS